LLTLIIRLYFLPVSIFLVWPLRGAVGSRVAQLRKPAGLKLFRFLVVRRACRAAEQELELY